MFVVKRDGSEVIFEENKVRNALIKSGLTDDNKLNFIVEDVLRAFSDNDKLTVDNIQHIVENALMDLKEFDIARNYITYRYLHDVARNKYNELLNTIEDKLFVKSRKNQNANVDEESFGGRVGETSDAIMKQYALDYCMSDKSKYNHENNIIYIHDLSSYAIGNHNCLSIPFDDLLARGFNTRQTDVRPAQSVSTAFQLVAVIFQLQSLQQFGGVSATHLDWTMIPYVRKSFNRHYCVGLKYTESESLIEKYKKLNIEDTSIDDDIYKEHANAYKYAMDMTIKEIEQSVEGMYHNLNTLQSRSGNQLPFSSINYGTCTEKEGRLVIKALLDKSIEGVGRLHKTSIFPCGIFQCMKGVNRKEGEPNYDLFKLALKSTALRLYPNYANVDWSVNEGYDKNNPSTYVATMGCRTYNGYDINGFGQLKDGRGNIAPVTIILPTIAMMAKESNKDNLVDTFMDLLGHTIDDAKDMLIERYNWICSQSPNSAKFMYENNVMAGYDGKTIESAMKHGTLAIGQLGLAEALQIIIGKDHTTEEGMKLARKIETLFSNKCKKYKNHFKLNFGVYYSPAENLCYTAMRKFKDKYGYIENVSDKEFFTNSMHIPVWRKLNPFEKIDLESQLTGYSSAGCITYVELDSSSKHNIEALEELVNYAMDKDIPYFAINVPNDTCMDCGYCDEMSDICPVCGSNKIQRLRRVTGYLTSDYKTAFNIGKQQEVELRVKHAEVREE